MKPLPKKYDHKVTEKKWQQSWEEQKIYGWDESQPRENTYVIDTPPPTVSGLLHMGHIFSYTQTDFVARFQRMSGKTVFYPMGFDDNGLPTERLVEKSKKVRATDMSREDFTKLCDGVAEEARVEFRKLFQSVALSVDWDQEYHTISDECRQISQMSFLDLYKKGRVYRKLQPMLWDPVDQTAIAQAEVEDKEMEIRKNYLRFGLMDEQSGELAGDIEIMTTRPELLGACVAVMCHPDDVAKYKGKQAVTPVFGVKVPIVADEKVDKEKGTGLVMCCTFGDETDIEWWREHDLDTRLLLNKYGKIAVVLDEAGVTFNGCEIKDSLTAENTVDIAKTVGAFENIQNKKVRTTAREAVLEMLDASGALLKQDKTLHAEPCAERSGSPLELIPTYQWFVKILDIKEDLKKKAAECTWYPEFMRVRIEQWIDGLSWDWCISRQRYFGVPFPVWYVEDANGQQEIVVAEQTQLPANPLVDLPAGYTLLEKNEDGSFKAKRESDGAEVLLTPEADVMDTWATSSVSPQLSSKAINKEFAVDYGRHQKLFPADVRPQAHEIIRTWAFYTIVKAYLHEEEIPWKNLMISGWCLASDKTKMSKSKGNVVTPVELIENKGADAVRFWASTSRLGSDTAFSEDVLKIGNKLVNKLWNATKFAAIHLDKLEVEPSTAQEDCDAGNVTEALDKWILTRLGKAVAKATVEFEKYEYSNARAAVEDFFWNDFCDNYLELVKVRVYGEAEGVSKEAQASAVHTIYHCLDGILRLFAPFVPHITEELYTHIFDAKTERLGDSIHARGTWPKAETYPSFEVEEKAGIATVEVLNAVRKLKAERGVSIKWPLNFVAVEGKSDDASLAAFAFDLKSVTNASTIWFEAKDAEEGQGASTDTDDKAFKVSVEFAKEADAA